MEREKERGRRKRREARGCLEEVAEDDGRRDRRVVAHADQRADLVTVLFRDRAHLGEHLKLAVTWPRQLLGELDVVLGAQW